MEFYQHIVLISVIEVASGEYDPDMTKMAKAAMKRYEKTTAAHRIRDVTKNSGQYYLSSDDLIKVFAFDYRMMQSESLAV